MNPTERLASRRAQHPSAPPSPPADGPDPAPDPGEVATRFMAIQLEALHRAAPRARIDPAAFYGFAAGVYQGCARTIPELNGHDRIPTAAELASFMPGDPAAAALLCAGIAAAPTWHSVRGRAECEKWLTRRRYDPHALAQHLSLGVKPVGPAAASASSATFARAVSRPAA